MITFYLLNNPAYLNEPQTFQVGFIDIDGSLINITNDCSIRIIHPAGAKIVDLNSLIVNSIEQFQTIELAISYLDYPIFYTEFTLVRKIIEINQSEIYNTFLKYLPRNVYTNTVNSNSPVYCDNTATTTALAQIYNNSSIENPDFVDLNTVISRFFPESGYQAWEQYLVGTNGLYLQHNTNYGQLLQLLYQTNINNNTNPYFLAYNISRYIYYRLGLQYYVYIGEDTFDASGAFILDLNSLGHCVLSGSSNQSTSTEVIIYIINGTGMPIRWIPSDQSGAGLDFVAPTANYSEADNLINLFLSIDYPANDSTLTAIIGFLPDDTFYNQILIGYTSNNIFVVGHLTGSTIVLIDAQGNAITNAMLSTKNVKLSGMYQPSMGTIWTPADGSGAALSFTVTDSIYTKVLNVLNFTTTVTYPITVDVSAAVIDGLPFAAAYNEISVCHADNNILIIAKVNGTTLVLQDAQGNAITNSQLSGATLVFSGSYQPTTGIMWTPMDSSGAGLSFSSITSGYSEIPNLLQISNIVDFAVKLTYPTTLSTAPASITGLPIPGSGEVALGYTDNGVLIVAKVGATLVLQDAQGNNLTNAQLSGRTITISGTYQVSGTGLSLEFQKELNIFVRRIMRAGDLVSVDYSHTFADFGLTSIGNTYWKDPRQQNTYCIEYNPGELTQALGYSGGSRLKNLVDFTVTLIPGGSTTSLLLGQLYEVVITPTFSMPTTLLKPIIQYTEFFCSDTSIAEFYMVNGVEYFNPVSIGTCQITIYLGTLSKIITYTITDGYFTLDESELDIGILA